MSEQGHRFPNDSDEYRAARSDLLQAEVELRRRIAEVAALRRSLPLGGEVPDDYVFDEWDDRVGKVKTTRLSELFAPGKDTLFVYNFMFRRGPLGEPLEVPCPSCTAIVDGIDGIGTHLEERLNLVVVAKAPIEAFAAHARARGWTQLRLLSSAGNSFKNDYGAEGEGREQFPIANVFVKRDGRIHHFWSSELFWTTPEAGQHPRHVDFMWPLWAILDRTPEGRGADWEPALDYASA